MAHTHTKTASRKIPYHYFPDESGYKSTSRSEKVGEERNGESRYLPSPPSPCLFLAVAVSHSVSWPELSLGPRNTASSLVPSDLEMVMVSTVAGSREPGGPHLELQNPTS